MKKKNVWILLMVLAVSILILFGYIVADRLRTDSEAPKIAMDAPEISLSVQENRSALLKGVTAYDDVSGDVTDSLVIESVYGVTEDHRVTVTYAAFDQAGNVSKAERLVHYTDYVGPRFSLSGSLTMEHGSTVDVMSLVGAEDVFDGDIKRRVKATMLSSGSSVTEEGIHDVQFRVTNSMGDTVQLVLQVEVYPIDSYNAQLALTEYLVYLPQGAAFEREDYLLEFQARNEKMDLSRGIPDGLQVRIDGTVDSQTVGVYPVSYTVSYTLNGQKYTGYSKLFVVVEG